MMLLDPIGVPGIWFPLGLGVSRTQYVYAIAIPLLAVLIVRTASLAGRRSRRLAPDQDGKNIRVLPLEGEF